MRYDLRDTGQSMTYPPGEPGYTWSDLIDDAAGLLDPHFYYSPGHEGEARRLAQQIGAPTVPFAARPDQPVVPPELAPVDH